jgi:hypothetical protein
VAFDEITVLEGGAHLEVASPADRAVSRSTMRRSQAEYTVAVWDFAVPGRQPKWV